MAIIASFLTVILPVALITYLFSLQIFEIFKSLSGIGEQLAAGIETILNWVYDSAGMERITQDEWWQQQMDTIVNSGVGILSEGLNNTGIVLVYMGFTLLYTFFFLLYRAAFKNFITQQTPPKYRNEAPETLLKIQSIAQNYLYGMLTVMVILAVLNSVGLWLIGIEYAFFWGCLAAFMAIIPYIGTTLGGTLPFLYALSTTGTLWQPAAVVILYFSIQQLEGNIITPKVVGSHVDINPLVAVIALFIGGMIWGIGGLILALPMIAMIKIIIQQINLFKNHLSLLMSSHIAKKYHRFYRYAR